MGAPPIGWITRDNERVTASSSVFTVYESRHSKHNLIKQDTTYAEDEFLSVIHGCSALRTQRMAGRAFIASEKCQASQDEPSPEMCARVTRAISPCLWLYIERVTFVLTLSSRLAHSSAFILFQVQYLNLT